MSMGDFQIHFVTMSVIISLMFISLMFYLFIPTSDFRPGIRLRGLRTDTENTDFCSITVSEFGVS